MKKWWALTGLSIVCGAGSMDFAIVNTALPVLQHDLHASIQELQWMMSVITIALAALLPTMGRFADVFGRRLMFYSGAMGFIVFSLLAGFSINPLELILFRLGQGITFSMLFPTTLAIITNIFDDDNRSKAIGIWSGMLGVGMAIGPVVGGFLVSFVTWRAIFFFLALFAVIGVIIASLSVEKTVSTSKGDKIDWWGFFLLTLGMSLLVVSIIEIPVFGWTAWMIGSVIVAMVCLILFVVVENMVTSPIINFSLISHPLYWASMVASFAVGFFAWSTYFILPLFFFIICGYKAYQIGLMLVVISGMVVIITLTVGHQLKKLGFSRMLMSGVILFIATAILLLFFTQASSLAYFVVSLIIFGIAWGLIYVVGPAAAMSVIDKNHAGMASGALVTFRNIGSALGLAFGGSLFRVLYRDHLNGALMQQNINLTTAQHSHIEALLSQPEKLQTYLGQFTSGVSHQLLYVFNQAFMTAYRGVMWLLIIVAIIAVIITTGFLLRCRGMKKHVLEK